MPEDYLPDFCRQPTLILGCGNFLFGDDGFGPAVVKYLEEHYPIPQGVYVLDAGTGIQDILCTIALSSQRPKRLVLVDAMDRGAEPGEVTAATLDEHRPARRAQFSLHGWPTLDLLKDLSDSCGIEVGLVLVQPEPLPPEVQPGLSARVQTAVKKACEHIKGKYL